MRRCKVFIICSGLGHIRRGFESFTQECFDALSQEPSLDITLFKGAGRSSKKEVVLWNFQRTGRMAVQLGRLTKRDPYFVEQASFFLNLLPYLSIKKPDVVYFSDGTLGNLLWHWRRSTRQNYKLLFSNGGPLSPPFDRWDHIQQVAPFHLQIARNAGTPLEKQSLIPYGLHIPSKLQLLTSDERKGLRRQLRIDEERPVILSVAAINKSHKRMDYIIREVARLPEPRPYLILLGQRDSESDEVINSGMTLLGASNFQIKTVDQHDVSNYYRVADAFVLASIGEGFGRVLLEAMSQGLPCLVHDYETTRYILDEYGYFADFLSEDNLAGLIQRVMIDGNERALQHKRHRSVYERFSWEKLRPAYVAMIQQCVNSYAGNLSVNVSSSLSIQ